MNDKQYKLSILPLFEDDLNEIVDYMIYRLKSPLTAEHFITDVEKAIYDRLPYAESFEQYHSVKERQYPYYRIPVKNYTIFYVVIGDTMEIRRILYNKRNLKKLI